MAAINPKNGYLFAKKKKTDLVELPETVFLAEVLYPESEAGVFLVNNFHQPEVDGITFLQETDLICEYKE